MPVGVQLRAHIDEAAEQHLVASRPSEWSQITSERPVRGP